MVKKTKSSRLTNNLKQYTVSKLTAVEWLVQQLIPAIALQEKHIDDLAQQAKEMERSQIVDGYNQGYRDGEVQEYNSENDVSMFDDAINYYNQTFKTD